MIKRRRFIQTGATAAFALAFESARAERSEKLRGVAIGQTGRGAFGHGLDTMWLGVPGVEVGAVSDPEPAGLSAPLARLKLQRGYRDYRQMLAKTRPAIVAICRRHIDQHRDMFLAAAESGARGVYIEMPFCGTTAEAMRSCGPGKRAG